MLEVLVCSLPVRLAILILCHCRHSPLSAGKMVESSAQPPAAVSTSAAAAAAGSLQSPGKLAAGLEKPADSNSKPLSTSASNDPTERASAALASASLILSSLHPALSASAVAQLRLHALSHLCHSAASSQQAVAAVSSLHATFPALLSKHINLLTRAADEAVATAAHFTADAASRALLLPHLTALLASFHAVLSYLPSTHSICPATRAQLYRAHLLCMLDSPAANSALQHTYLLYTKHLPSAQRDVLRQLAIGAAEDKQAMEDVHAAMLVNTAYGTRDRHDAYKLLRRACDAVSDKHSAVCARMQMAQWLYAHTASRQDALDVLLAALDSIHDGEAEAADAQHQLGDTQRSHKSDGSRKRAPSTASSLVGTSNTLSATLHPHAGAGQSRRQSVSSNPPTHRQRAGSIALDSSRRKSLVSTADGSSRSTAPETRSLGVRDLCLLVRGYTMVAAMSETEDERLEWTLTAAHFAYRIWTTNLRTLQHHCTTQQQHHDKLLHERANKLLVQPNAQLPDIPPLDLPTLPALPTTAAEWLDVRFDAAVVELMESEGLRGGCMNGWSLVQPLALYSSVQVLVERLARHGYHVQCLPLVALQLRLASLHVPQLRLLPLTRLRAALLCDSLCLETQCQQLLSEAEGEWMPTRKEVEECEKLRQDRQRQRELAERKQQRAAVRLKEEHKEQMALLNPSASQLMSPTPSPNRTGGAANSSPSATFSASSHSSQPGLAGCPPLTVAHVWVHTAELLLLTGRHGPARVLLALSSAHAETLGLHDLHLLSTLVSATSLLYQRHLTASLRLSATVAASETRSTQWRRSVRLLLDAVRMSASGVQSSDSVLKRQAGTVDKLLAACSTRLQQPDVAGLHAFTRECAIFLHGLQAQTMVEQASRSLLPPLPLSASLLAAADVLRDPSLVLPSSSLLASYSHLQQCYLHAFSLLDRALSQCEQLGDRHQLALLVQCRAYACWQYAKLWSDRSVLRRSHAAAFGEDERKSLAYRHLSEALRWFQRAEEAAKQHCNDVTTSSFGQPPSATSTSLSLPIHRHLARIQADIALLYCDLFRATFPPALFAPTSSNSASGLPAVHSPSSVDGENEAEQAMMEEWMDKYADVFSASPPPPPPSLPLAAIASAQAALQLHKNARAHFVLGHAHMTRMEEERESERQQRKKAEKEERRRKEKEEWKKRVYAKPETEEQRAIREKAEEEEREAVEQQQMAQQEQLRAAELQKQIEDEERKKREEDEAAALKSSRGKKGAKAAAAIMSPSKKAEAERVEVERREKEEKRREEERQEKEKQDKEALAAEEDSFGYDESDWSPVYLLRWKREIEREKLESRLQEMEEQTKAASGGKAGKDKEEKRREKVRQPSAMSMSMSDEDDGLDPTILMDEPFDEGTLAHSAYSHLFSSLMAALESHDLSLLASASLSLVHLFTTRHPLLSSKYLSLYLSAVVNKYVIDLASSLQPASEEMVIYGEKQRLKGRRCGITGDDSDSRGGGWCWQAGTDMVDEYLDDRSLLSQWTTIPTPYEDEKEEVVLRGWDSTYAQMLVSIPSSVSIVTLLYMPDEHAVYVSLLSSVGFPLSSRFSRTVLSEAEEDQLQSLIRYFRSFSSTLSTPLASASSPASSARLDELDSTFTANVALLTSLFTLPFHRALLSCELLDDRDVILLPCPLLFCLPWESVPLLHGHRSLCRDFSFAFFSRRMEQSSADNVSREHVGYAIDALAADSQRSMERAMSPLVDNYGKGWKGRKGRDGRVHDWEWKGLLEEGRDGGAFFYVGYEPLLPTVQAATLNGVDCTGLRLAVLMDHAVRERGAAAADGAAGGPVQDVKGEADGGGGVYDTSVLLSVRGVNTILTHAWSVSEAVNASHTFLLSSALYNGQSVASAVKLLTNMQQCEPLPQRPASSATDVKPALASPSGKKQKGASTPKAATTPKGGRGMTPKGGRTPRVGVEEGKESGMAAESAVRVFDRYNTVLIGLPHWRM